MPMPTDTNRNDKERQLTDLDEPVINVLGIEVNQELLLRWTGWFAPKSQPFLIPKGHRLETIGERFDPKQNPEIRDTFEIYGEEDRILCRAVDAEAFLALPRDERSNLIQLQVQQGRPLVPAIRSWPNLSSRAINAAGNGLRFLWWPHLLVGHAEEILIPYIEEGRLPSRHREVPEEVWLDASSTLPGARAIAGTFALASGPNCFGTVMAAAGVEGASLEWTLREPFEEWLTQNSSVGGNDEKTGTLLIWRSDSGQVEHAAVTLGGGLALHKPSQGWMSPVKVLRVAEIIQSARSKGRRLTRRQLE